MPTKKPKKVKDSQTINVIMPLEMYEKIRKCSFETKKSISQIAREGIDIILKKYEKVI